MHWSNETFDSSMAEKPQRELRKAMFSSNLYGPNAFELDRLSVFCVRILIL